MSHYANKASSLFLLRWVLGSLCLGLLLWCCPQLVGQDLRYDSLKAKVRIEGTSNIDDWQVEGRSVSGVLVFDRDFPTNASSSVTPPGKVSHAQVSISVQGLRSIEKDGKPFSNLMDEIMRTKLKAELYPVIFYRLKALESSGLPRAGDQAYRFTARGDLVVAGVTNAIVMPVSIAPMPGQGFRVTGNTSLRMTDFHVEPPAPKIALGIVKTGDEVKILFELVATRAHSAATPEPLPR